MVQLQMGRWKPGYGIELSISFISKSVFQRSIDAKPVSSVSRGWVMLQAHTQKKPQILVVENNKGSLLLMQHAHYK